MQILTRPIGTRTDSFSASLDYDNAVTQSGIAVSIFGYGPTEQAAKDALIEQLKTFVESAKTNILNHNIL